MHIEKETARCYAKLLVLAGAAVAGSLPTSAGTAIEYDLIVALWP
jgi:hypothetical protein